AVTNRALPEGTSVVGEVGLAGELRSVSQLARRLQEAQRAGYGRLIGPRTGPRAGARTGPRPGARTEARTGARTGASAGAPAGARSDAGTSPGSPADESTVDVEHGFATLAEALAA